MMFFICLIISAMIFFVGCYSQKKWGKFVMAVSCAIPVFLATYRGINVGTDTGAYYYMYNIYGSQYSFVELFQKIGFKEFFNSIFIYFNYNYFNFNIYLCIYSTLSFVFLYKALRYYMKEKEIFLSFFLYLFMLYPSSLNIMRQMTAAAIVFWGFKFVFERKLVKFILVILLACGFHMTSIMVLPFYFIVNKKVNIKWVSTSLLSMCLIILLVNFNSFISFFSTLDDSFSRYSIYESNDLIISKIFFLNILIFISCIVIVRVTNDNMNKIYLLFLFFGILLDTTGFLSPFLKRLALYFNIFQIVLLAKLPSIVYRNEKKIVSMILLILVIGYYYLSYIWQGFSGLFPFELYIYPT